MSLRSDAGELPALMQTPSDIIDKDGKVALSETDWKWKADYPVPTTEQAKVLTGAPGQSGGADPEQTRRGRGAVVDGVAGAAGGNGPR